MSKNDRTANIYSYSPAEVNEAINETFAELAKVDTPNANGDVIESGALLRAIKPIIQNFALPAIAEADEEGSPDDPRMVQVDPASGPDETVIRGFPASEFVHADIGLGDRLWEETVIRAMWTRLAGGVPPDFLANSTQVPTPAENPPEDNGRALVHEVGQVKRVRGERGRGVIMLQRPIPGARMAFGVVAGATIGAEAIRDMNRRMADLIRDTMENLINQAGLGMVVEDVRVQQDPDDSTKVNVTGRVRPANMRETARAYFNQKWLEERTQEFREKR